jgi:hypothetical protein
MVSNSSAMNASPFSKAAREPLPMFSAALLADLPSEDIAC